MRYRLQGLEGTRLWGLRFRADDGQHSREEIDFESCGRFSNYAAFRPKYVMASCIQGTRNGTKLSKNYHVGPDSASLEHIRVYRDKTRTVQPDVQFEESSV